MKNIYFTVLILSILSCNSDTPNNNNVIDSSDTLSNSNVNTTDSSVTNLDSNLFEEKLDDTVRTMSRTKGENYLLISITKTEFDNPNFSWIDYELNDFSVNVKEFVHDDISDGGIMQMADKFDYIGTLPVSGFHIYNLEADDASAPTVVDPLFYDIVGGADYTEMPIEIPNGKCILQSYYEYGDKKLLFYIVDDNKLMDIGEFNSITDIQILKAKYGPDDRVYLMDTGKEGETRYFEFRKE